MFKEYRFSFDQVCPTPEVLAGYLQMPDLGGYSLVETSVKEIFAILADTQEIVGGYRILDCTGTNVASGEVECTAGILHTGRRITGYMKGASQIALFICTAGQIFTDLSHVYQQSGDFLEAFVVESIGSATVENAMDKIQIALEIQMAEEGRKITNRYSPGYCEWHLSGQRDLFSYLDEQTTGVCLNDSCLMQPIKSVSGIIGIGDEVRKRPYGCAICNSTTCTYRHLKK